MGQSFSRRRKAKWHPKSFKIKNCKNVTIHVNSNKGKENYQTHDFCTTCLNGKRNKRQNVKHKHRKCAHNSQFSILQDENLYDYDTDKFSTSDLSAKESLDNNLQAIPILHQRNVEKRSLHPVQVNTEDKIQIQEKSNLVFANEPSFCFGSEDISLTTSRDSGYNDNSLNTDLYGIHSDYYIQNQTEASFIERNNDRSDINSRPSFGKKENRVEHIDQYEDKNMIEGKIACKEKCSNHDNHSVSKQESSPPIKRSLSNLESKSHENNNTCKQDGKTHENGNACKLENKTHENGEECKQESNTNENIDTWKPESITHEDRNTGRTESKTHERSNTWKSGSRTHEDSKTYKPESKTHEDSNACKPESNTQEDRNACKPENKNREDSNACQPESKIHEGSNACKPESKIHEDSNACQPERKIQKGSNACQPESKIHEDSNACKPESKIHEDSNAFKPESNIHEDSNACQPESKNREDSNACKPESKTHEDSNACQPESKIHEDSNAYTLNSKNREDSNAFKPESKTHEDSNACQPESKIHENSNACQPESKIHEDSNACQPESKTHEDSNACQPESKTNEDSNAYLLESKIHEDSYARQPKSKIHENRNTWKSESISHEDNDTLKSGSKAQRISDDNDDENRAYKTDGNKTVHQKTSFKDNKGRRQKTYSKRKRKHNTCLFSQRSSQLSCGHGTNKLQSLSSSYSEKADHGVSVPSAQLKQFCKNCRHNLLNMNKMCDNHKAQRNPYPEVDNANTDNKLIKSNYDSGLPSSEEHDSWSSWKSQLNKLCKQELDMIVLKDIARRMYVDHFTSYQVLGLRTYFDRVNTGIPLSEEEQHQFEWLRFISFNHYQGNGNGIVLARNGFYHHPEDGPNSTRCFACGFKYNEWDMFDNVDEIHRKRSPNCPLLHGNIGEGTRRNISIDSDDVPRRRPVQQQTAVTAEPTGRNVQDSEPVRSTSSSLSSSAAAAATSGASSVSSVAATSTVSSAGSFIHSHLPSQSRNPIATSLTRVSGLGNFGRPVATTTQPVTVPSSAKPQSLFSAPSTSASAVASSASAFGGLATRVADTHISSAEGDQHSGFTRMQPTSDPNNTDRMYNLNPTTQIRGMGMVDEPYNEISVPPPQQGIRVSGNHPPSSLFGGGPVGAGGFTTGQPQSMPVSGHTQVSELRSSSVPLVQGLSGSPGLTPHQKARPPPPSTQQALSYQQRGQGLGGGSGPEGAPPDRARGTGLPGLDPDLTAGIHIVSPRHPDYNTLTSRINSFSGWPSHLDQNPRMMGEAGFFYVGVADFCRCYACGGGLRNWQPGDDPVLEHARRFPQCEYIIKLKGQAFVTEIQRHVSNLSASNSTPAEAPRLSDNNSQDPFDCETGRQLMSNDFPQARTRRAIRALRITHGRDPTPVEVLDWMLEDHTDHEPGRPQSMPVSGHTQVSELRSSSVPLVQGLSTSPGLTPHQEARPPPPSTQQALSYQQRGQGLGGGSGPEGAPPDRARGTGLPGLDPDFTAGIHIVSPRHPDYNTLTSRINSFSGWPSHLDQNPRMMGEAGFFYVGTGVADFCRCYACGGGLRNWQPGDDPVLEHARRFPQCEYIIKLKGQAFVTEIQRHVSNLSASNSTPAEAPRLSENNSQDPLDCETGRQLMSMGFPQARTRRAIRALRITHGRDPTPDEVLDWMLEDHTDSETEDSESATPSAILQPTSSITHSSTTTTTTTSNLTTAPTGSINVSVTSSTSYFSRGASQENTKREATPPTVTNQREISPSGGKIREANTGEGKDSRMEDDVRVGNSDKQEPKNGGGKKKKKKKGKGGKSNQEVEPGFTEGASGGPEEEENNAENNSQDPLDCETGRQLMSMGFPQARTRRAIRALRRIHGRDPTPDEVLDWMLEDHTDHEPEDSESAIPAVTSQPTTSITHSSTTTTTTITKREATSPTFTNQREISPSGGKIRETNTGEGKDSRREDDVRVGNSDKHEPNNGGGKKKKKKKGKGGKSSQEVGPGTTEGASGGPEEEENNVSQNNRPSAMFGGGPVWADAFTAEPNNGGGKKKKKKKGKGGKSSQEVGPGTTEGASGGPEEEENNGLHPQQQTIIPLPSTQNAPVYKHSAQGLEGGSGPGGAPPDRARGSGLPDPDLNAESPYNRPSPMIGGESVGACAVTADDGTQIRQENEKLLKKLKCGICMERQVGTTLLPCGHLVTCDRCASRLSKCPICRTKIKGSVKTFMT
ncbi:uncharacterized protein LOC128237116 isoform X3 [Mya arenaria]|uniref:uncharacterized protein LOC128237116 isoform X3 n=1 Tax=Mya arenaria TaxID=6604 RepID=UPI0022E29064|nr:uncharacterized protein LOC128237116 isoform X3 [Mya arenaria]